MNESGRGHGLRVAAPLQAVALALAVACAPQMEGAGEVNTGEQEQSGLKVEGSGQRPWYHDFGEVPFGEIREHTFRLTNVSPDPVTLLDVQGMCSCSSVKRVLARLPDGRVREGSPRAENGMLLVPPGAVAELTLRIDTGKAKPNQPKLEVMRLRTDSDLDPFITFELAVRPRQLFQATPTTLDLGDIPTSHGASGEVVLVTGERGTPARVLRVEEAGERVHALLEEQESLGETVWTLGLTLPEQQPLGVLRDRVLLATTDEYGEGDTGRFEVQVWGRVVEDLIVRPRQISLGAAASAESFQTQAELVALVPGERVLLREFEVTGTSKDWIRVEPTPVSPDPRGRTQLWELAIERIPGHPQGRVDATLRLHTDDPDLPQVEAALVGYVR